METIEHQGKNLLYLTVHPDNYRPKERYPLIILLHGYGSNMHDLATLVPDIDREGYVYACPNAPVAIQIAPGMVGYGWGGIDRKGNSSDLQRVEDLLWAFCDAVMEQYHVSPGQVMLGGFSQGAGMTYRCGLSRPHVFSGLIALSGASRDINDLKGRLPPQRTQSIFVAHGIDDSVAPVERGRSAVAFLKAEGYTPWYKEYPMGHEITMDVLADLVPWVQKVLPPLRAG